MTASLTMDDQSLVFAKSESKAVGFFGKLRDFISDNSARVVGTMKLAGDIFIGFSGNPWLIGYSVFAGLGRIMLMIYGTKDHQKKVAEEHKHNPQAKQETTLGKVMHPREYPVETSAGLSVVAETLGVGYGATRFLAGATGFTQLILGGLAVMSYASILLGKDKKKKEEKGDADSLTFAKSKSKPVGFTGRIKDFFKNSEVMGNVMLFTLTGGLLVGAIIEGYGAAYITGASILLVANAIQALFVRKKKFNIEGAQEETQNKIHTDNTPAKSFEERLAEKRARENDTGLQPT